jgi:Na+/H+-dicarboxylate symporter
VAATFDVQAMGPVAKLVALLYAGCAAHALIVYGGLIRIICNLPFLRFLGGVLTPFSVAVATTSSNATLPATMHAVERNFGVSNRVASFVVSLGATLNKDGTAMFLALAAIFGAQAYGVALDPAAYAIIIAMSILCAVGAAGVPGAGLIISSLVLSAVNVPLETIAMLAAIDRILDMPRTALNVVGDCSASVVVAKWENELDRDIFRGKKGPMDELVTDESPAKQQA